jgi:hypothetical protein
VGPAVRGVPDAHRLGRRRFLVGVGAAAGAGAMTSLLPADITRAASLPANASMFTPLSSGVRLADTRPPYNYPRIEPNLVRVKVRAIPGVPANASAVVLTVTAKDRFDARYVTVYPTGNTRPVVSNLNMVRGPGEVTANLVTVKVGDLDSVDIFQFNPCDVIVDILGYYTPVTSAVRGGRFVRLETAARAIDTRQTFGYAASGSFTSVDLTDHVPEDASSAVINLTATQSTGGGFFTALASTADESKIPETSSLNVVFPGDTRAASVIAPIVTVGGRRRIKIYTSRAAKLIVDVNGYYTGATSPESTDGLFVPLTPVRILDTRLPGQIGKLWPGWVVEARVPGEAASGSAIIANVTGVATRGAGYLTVAAARQPLPSTSNVNWTSRGAVVPNHAITPITGTEGAYQVFCSSGAHILVDLAGYFTGTPLKWNGTPAPRNPPPPAVGPPWVLSIPRLGLTSNVFDGDPEAVTDAGHTWHWTGTGLMGQTANVAMFGHRTEHGGPYRYIHNMQIGDTWTVTTTDNREFTYRMVGRTMVTGANSSGPPVANILAASRRFPGTTLSIIACTRTDWLPTSLNHRIVVTGELVSWREF